jgi:hypothetical protein
MAAWQGDAPPRNLCACGDDQRVDHAFRTYRELNRTSRTIATHAARSDEISTHVMLNARMEGRKRLNRCVLCCCSGCSRDLAAASQRGKRYVSCVIFADAYLHACIQLQRGDGICAEKTKSWSVKTMVCMWMCIYQCMHIFSVCIYLCMYTDMHKYM